VTFTVVSGPNAGKGGTAMTNASGVATFTYSDTGGAGTDTIKATFVDSAGKTQTSNTVTKTWTGDGEVPPTVTGGGPPSGVGRIVISTPAAAPTQPVQQPTVVNTVQAAEATPRPSGGASGVISAPNTGQGSSADGSMIWMTLSLIIAAAGATVAVTGLGLRRR
jgi:hypothetical protein